MNIKKILGGVGLALLVLGLVIWMSRSGKIKDGAQAHAEYFLSKLQSQSYPEAFAAKHGGDTSSHDGGEFERCFRDTPLGDMTSYDCTSVDVTHMRLESADVTCSIQSASQGGQEITVNVNSAADLLPYLGFVWFSPSATLGSQWSGDGCTSYSGREFFRDPPPGRVRPTASP